MRYRSLGQTGLRVSEIGFGTIPILRGNVPVLPEYYSPDDETAVEIMMHAYRKGCNFFDTAIVPEYGDAEIKLGLFARRIGRENIIIGDKARFFHGNEMYGAVQVSCGNLGTYADIYYVHQVDRDNQDIVFGKSGALDALIDLKAEGKILHVGIATHYYDILLRAATDKRVDVLQGSGNILERGMLDRIMLEPAFKQKGVVINKVYAAGILPRFFSEEILKSGVLAYPISCALIGLGSCEQADIALANREKADYEVISFERVLSVLQHYFEPIPCDRCQQCSCVYGTDISTIFRQYNYYFLGKDYWALRKLNMSIAQNARWCRNCSSASCMKCCPKGIRIPQVMQKAARLAEVYSRDGMIDK